MKKSKDLCKGCIWAERISHGLVFCLFPQCVQGKLPTEREEKEWDKLDGEPGKTVEGH